MLQVHVECGRHPNALRRWFPAPEPDPFFEEDTLASLYGDAWTSIVIEEDGHALRHAFAASAIGTTGLFDIEPLVGYAGLLATPGAPAEFLIAALERYSALCRENGIVGELVRFNPLLQNQRALEGLSGDLVLPEPRLVVYLAVHKDDSACMSSYPPETRNMIRTGYRSANVSRLEKTPEIWTRFRHLYADTLDATRAGPEWALPLDLWERLRRSRRFVFVGALQRDQLVSGAIALVHGTTCYYFLAARVRDREARRGAGNAVVHEITRAAAGAGASHVGLGGGRTASGADSLFAFKRSFGGDVLPFRVGLFAHDRVELDALIQAAERSDSSVCASPLFLRFRLARSFSEGRMLPVSIRSLVERPGVAQDREHFIL
jgi:Acetyltransferase (GNAT) domain